MQDVIDDKKVMGNIAEHFRRLRGDRTFAEMARITNERLADDDWVCYAATFQQIEAGEHRPNIVILKRLCMAWDLSLDTITNDPAPIERRRHAKSA